MTKRKAQSGDFLVVEADREERKVRHLVKVTDVAEDGSEYYTVIEKDRHLAKNSNVYTVKPDMILVNLGSKPPLGTVYGQDTGKIYQGRKHHEAFGALHFFIRPDKEQQAKFYASMDRVARRLTKMGFDIVLNNEDLMHEVHHRKGKYAGMFIPSHDVEKRPHRIEYYIDAEVESYDYLISHEIGHYIHIVGLQSYPKVNAAWLRLYNETIAPREISRESMIAYHRALAAQELEPTTWITDLEDDEKADWKLILKWVSQVRGLRPKDLNLLWGEDAAGKDEVMRLLPRSGLQSKDIKPSVSEYATKNYRELFAECLAYRMTGKSIPKSCSELLDKSLSLAKIGLKKE